MIHDAIVVGAGPSGSHAAERLARLGHDVVLLDDNEGPRASIVCTGIVGAEAFERMELPRRAVVDTVRRAAFISPSGVRVLHEPEEPMAYVVDRVAFDRSLIRRATDAGATLYRGHAARSLEKGEDRVTVRAKAGGESRRIHGRAVVVATGHQRWLHEEAGLGVPTAYVHGVHADLPFRDLDATELFFGRDVAPGFFAWAAPFGDGTARLGVLSPQGSRRYFQRFVQKEAIGDRLGLTPADEGLLESHLQSRAIVQGPIEPSYADRVLAVGEAAGQVKTTTAGGIYYGLIGSEIASEVLDEGLRKNRLDATFLGRYQDRWWSRLGPEIRSGLELQRFAEAMEDGEVDRLFEALNNGLGPSVRRVVKFDWHRTALKALFSRKGVWRVLLERAPSLPLVG